MSKCCNFLNAKLPFPHGFLLKLHHGFHPLPLGSIDLSKSSYHLRRVDHKLDDRFGFKSILEMS